MRSADLDEDTSAGYDLLEVSDARRSEGRAATKLLSTQPDPASSGESPDDLQAALDPQEGSEPQCGLPTWTINTVSCNWERVTETTGTVAEHDCGGFYPISGSCYTNDSSHRLVNSYAAEATGNVMDDDDSFTDGWGWRCEWDTAATGTDTHSVQILCCTQTQFAGCG